MYIILKLNTRLICKRIRYIKTYIFFYFLHYFFLINKIELFLIAIYNIFFFVIIIFITIIIIYNINKIFTSKITQWKIIYCFILLVSVA